MRWKAGYISMTDREGGAVSTVGERFENRSEHAGVTRRETSSGRQHSGVNVTSVLSGTRRPWRRDMR